jgi:hypothetical protein
MSVLPRDSAEVGLIPVIVRQREVRKELRRCEIPYLSKWLKAS